MYVTGSSDQFEPLFPNDFLPDIVGRVFVAWDRIPKPVTETKETRITKLLRHQYAYDPIIKQLPFRVLRELTIDDPVTGDELGRIDLCLLHGNDEQVYFAYECKRLNVTFPSGKYESLAGEYVGADGIGCFILQKYARGQNHGGMIGYVLDGEIERAKNAIGDRLASARVDVALRSDGLLSSTLAPQNDRLQETRHEIDNVEFAVFHLFLSAR